jgi:hypothetical protein
MDWVKPMVQNPRPGVQLGFQMKSVPMNPVQPVDEARFHVRFYWDNEQHGATWVWTLVPHSTKDTWEFDYKRGSGVGQPRLEDTW